MFIRKKIKKWTYQRNKIENKSKTKKKDWLVKEMTRVPDSPDTKTPETYYLECQTKNFEKPKKSKKKKQLIKE